MNSIVDHSLESLAEVLPLISTHFKDSDYLQHFQHLSVQNHDSYANTYNYQYDSSNYNYYGNYNSYEDEFWSTFGVIMLYIIIAIILIFCYIGFMVAGFWLFPPMIVCLVMTGGELNTCSLNMFKDNGSNGLEAMFGGY